jgi:hypothetical protein
MVVGELHKVVGDSTIANTLCDISVSLIVDTIKEKIDKVSDSKILFVSEGYEPNFDFSRVIDRLGPSGFTKKNFLNMVELSERTLESNPHLRNITTVHSILLLLRDLDYYQSNPDNRTNTQFNMVVDVKYFNFLICKMYKLDEIFDEDVKLHFGYMANIIVYKRNNFGTQTFNYGTSCKVILNFLRARFFDGVPPSVQSIITDLIETKSIEQRLDKYDRFRTILREIRDNILVTRIEKNASNFDFDLIVIIFGCGHYENICRLIGEREELVLSTKSINPYDPAHLYSLEQSILSSFLSSSSSLSLSFPSI